MLFERKATTRNSRASKSLRALMLAVALSCPLVIPPTSLRAQSPVRESEPRMLMMLADDLKSVYDAAAADFKAGRLDDAQAKFQQLKDANYKAGFLQKSPDDYLKDIGNRRAEVAASDAKAAADAKAAEEKAAADKAAKDAKAAADAQAANVKTAYETGRKQYDAKDYENARKNLTIARDAGYKPGWFAPSPVDLLAKIDKAEADAQADAQAKAAADARAKAAEDAAKTPIVIAPTSSAANNTSEPSSMSAAEKSLQTAGNFDRIRTEHRQYEAQRKVAAAQAAMQSNRTDEAAKLYSEAADLDPSNAQAAAGKQETLALLGRSNAASTTLDAKGNEISQRRQLIRWNIDSSLTNANAAVAAKNFNAARAAIKQAQVARASDPGIFREDEIREFDTRIGQVDVAVQKSETEQAGIDRTAAEKAIVEEETVKRRRAEEEKKRTVAALIDESKRLQMDKKYVEAADVVDHIEQLDPTNEYVAAVKPLLFEKAQIQKQKMDIERREREMTRLLVDSDEKLIPYKDVLNYADNWPEISKMRDLANEEARGGSSDDQQLQAILEKRLPELKFTNNSFADVVDFLRDVTGANIYVDWPALERASINRDAPVTARLRDIKFSKALELIFRSVSGEEEEKRLAYAIDEGVITISTKKELDKNVITRQYDINDLLFVAPDFDSPDTSFLDSSNDNSNGGGTNGGVGGGGGGGGGGNGNNSLFGNNNNGGGGRNGGSGTDNSGSSREELIDEIKKYITDNVANTTWKDNGGEIGAISTSKLRAVLLVTQTPENQRKIAQLLEDLRKSQAIQVSIETRFLTVQRNYLQDVGVDFDLSLNGYYRNAQGVPTPSLGRTISNSWGPLGFAQSQISDNTTRVDPSTGQVTSGSSGQRQLDWVSRVGNAIVPGSFPSNTADYPDSLVINGSYVDNFTVNFLVRSVEANHHSTLVTAPRLTLFDGQHAYIGISTQQAYVSNLTPVVAAGVVGYQPDVRTIAANSVLLDVRATVSPDRKYVYMTLQPTLQRLRQLTTFNVSSVANINANTTNTGGTTTTTTQLLQSQIQQPLFDRTRLATSCAVPDGATLLLGGQTLAGETEREVGVPVLSKIPFLKRLFTNVASAQDEQILLILVRPQILINREIEAKAFPVMSAKLGAK